MITIPEAVAPYCPLDQPRCLGKAFVLVIHPEQEFLAILEPYDP
jgi:hypothetical protein